MYINFCSRYLTYTFLVSALICSLPLRAANVQLSSFSEGTLGKYKDRKQRTNGGANSPQ